MLSALRLCVWRFDNGYMEFVIDKLADYKKSLIYEVVTGKKEV